MESTQLKIGLDLDNTILDYSQCFTLAADKVLGLNLPGGMSKQDQKSLIQNSISREAWTKIQGFAYGEFSKHAELSPNFTEFLEFARAIEAELSIISHKSKFPILGPRQDLRGYALENLARLGVIEHIGKSTAGQRNVYFCDTRDQKIERIRTEGLQVFVDDLFGVLNSVNCEIQLFHIFCRSDHTSKEEVYCVPDWNAIRASLTTATSAES